jgi:hypothetical protein
VRMHLLTLNTPSGTITTDNRLLICGCDRDLLARWREHGSAPRQASC